MSITKAQYGILNPCLRRPTSFTNTQENATAADSFLSHVNKNIIHSFMPVVYRSNMYSLRGFRKFHNRILYFLDNTRITKAPELFKKCPSPAGVATAS